jgi:hypothetical protein
MGEPWGQNSHPPHPGKYPQMRALFPLFCGSSSDKPQLRARNEKAPFKGDLRKAYEIPRGFPRYSRHTHAVFTPSPPPCPFFEPKIFENFLHTTTCSGFFQKLHKPKRRLPAAFFRSYSLRCFIHRLPLCSKPSFRSPFIFHQAVQLLVHGPLEVLVLDGLTPGFESHSRRGRQQVGQKSEAVARSFLGHLL